MQLGAVSISVTHPHPHRLCRSGSFPASRRRGLAASAPARRDLALWDLSIR